MFMHGGWLHLLGNMLFLWIFGNNVEDRLGRLRFLLFYLGAGIAATALQTVMTLAFGAGGVDGPDVGASGAIAGVLGAYLLLYPRARVLTLVFVFVPVEVPAVVFLVLWFCSSSGTAASTLLAPAGRRGGVAFFAHIGGFVFGLLAALPFRAPPKRAPAWD